MLSRLVAAARPLGRSVRRRIPFRRKDLVVVMRLIRRRHLRAFTTVDPALVEYTVNLEDLALNTRSTLHFGEVQGGDWDLNGVPVREYGGVYTILESRNVHMMEYDDIPEFRANLVLIESGVKVDNCASEKQYRDKYIFYEGLVAKIRRDGYLSQRKLKARTPFNEVRLAIGRDGSLLFEESIHRLCIAKMLEIPAIPAIITRRHSDWVNREE